MMTRMTIEQARLADGRAGVAALGALPRPSGPGARCGRTTARTATPGATCPTTTPARGPTAGTRTAWPGISDDQQRLCFALAFWNGATRSSRSGSSG